MYIGPRLPDPLEPSAVHPSQDPSYCITRSQCVVYHVWQTTCRVPSIICHVPYKTIQYCTVSDRASCHAMKCNAMPHCIIVPCRSSWCQFLSPFIYLPARRIRGVFSPKPWTRKGWCAFWFAIFKISALQPRIADCANAIEDTMINKKHKKYNNIIQNTLR